MISVECKSLCSNLLVFKFENFNYNYPSEIKDFLNFSTNSGKLNELDCISTLGKSKYNKIFVLGLGVTENFTSSILFKTLGKFINKIKDFIYDLDVLDTFSTDFGYTLGECLTLSLYKYNGLKSTPQNLKLNKINIISKYTDSLKKGIISGNNINEARNLTNLPSNIVTPKYLMQKAQSIAEQNSLDIKIYDKYTLDKIGMNLISAVGGGSCHDYYLVILQYLGDPKNKEITALVGKGITFDTGGISLKSKKGMENMKGDMAGSASVLATMKTIAELKSKKNVIALLPIAENSISSKAYKPGDVIKSYSGKTVEIISTDAEGRLVLADAISYAKDLGATNIIEVSTLTGSCANFFGGINIGLSCNSNKLSDELINSGIQTGEYIWRLPNNEEYIEQLKTPNADLKNTGNNSGAIVAGLFLQSFVDSNVNFAHLDIAGCSASKKGNSAYDNGANGIPSRTLINYLLK